MSSGNLVLDITKTPKQIILAKFNLVNSMQLREIDIELGEPGPNQQVGTPFNSQIDLIPTLVGHFYNKVTLRYNRMDIESILSNSQVTVARGSGEYLSDLLPEINLKFGINLTTDDIYDTPVGAADPGDPEAEIPVMVSIKPESYFFYGSYVLQLNRATMSPTPDYEDIANVFVVKSQPAAASLKQWIEAYTVGGQLIAGYTYMRNALTIANSEIEDVVVLKNNDVVVLGSFTFQANLGGGLQTHTGKAMTLSPTGLIRSIVDAPRFGAGLSVKRFNLPTSDYTYVIQSGTAIGTDMHDVYRYTQSGILDSAFIMQDPGFPVVHLRECLDGKFYVASGIETVLVDHDGDPGTPAVSTKQRRIRRMLANGNVDTSFAQIVFRITGGMDPWPIGDIAPIVDGDGVSQGLYVSLLPPIAPANTAEVPVVNGVPATPANESTEYGYVPVFKFLQSGTRDLNFVIAQKSYRPNAVYEPTNANYAAGSALVFGDLDGVIFMTNRVNPLTTYTHPTPSRYGADGVLETQTGGQYLTTYRWSGATKALRLTGGTLITWGARIPQLLDGGWGDPVQTVATYDKLAHAQGIVTDTATPGVSIKHVFAVQD